MEILCFFAGTAFYYLKSIYPLYLLSICFIFRQKLAYLWWFLAAILWSILHQWLYSDVGMPAQRLIPKVTLQGVIASIPVKTPFKTQFQFLVERLENHSVKTMLGLSCYTHCPQLHAGQRWQLQAKIKRPINLANPGGFDYVAWLSSRHIYWVGTVTPQSFHLLNNQHDYPLLKLREQLADHLAYLVPDEKILGIFQALTLGLNQHIDKAQWDLFRLTGTTHLIDISGEHIAMIAGLSYWLSKWAWKHLGNCLWYPAPKIASIVAIIISSLYACIAGFAVPTQRALITCSFILLRNFGNQRLSTWQVWRYALLVVLLLEPHSVFMLGFYYSFLAVAILILINQRIRAGGLYKMLILQCACLLGLMPLTLYWFSYGSFNGLLANLIAIPWVSFFVVPLALFITFLAPWFVIPGSITLLKWSINCLLSALESIDHFFPFHFHFAFPHFLSPLALMGAMTSVLFLPSLSLLPTLITLVTASFFPNYDNVKKGDIKIDILDVGQGLATIIRTTHHTLIYDTGMKFIQGSDMGKLVIIPYLNYLGIRQIDTIVISHPDLDHRGGLTSLEENYAVKELVVDDSQFYHRGSSCHQYTTWNWDGVTFRFFPIPFALKGKNNHSCILQISNQAGRILLSGDIERRGETYLTKTYGTELASSVLIIPHHGSKTSSSLSFVQHVAPRFAIASYGFDNRYHFPHQQALAVYKKLDIPVFNTADCGMISILLHDKQFTPKCYLPAKWAR